MSEQKTFDLSDEHLNILDDLRKGSENRATNNTAIAEIFKGYTAYKEEQKNNTTKANEVQIDVVKEVIRREIEFLYSNLSKQIECKSSEIAQQTYQHIVQSTVQQLINLPTTELQNAQIALTKFTQESRALYNNPLHKETLKEFTIAQKTINEILLTIKSIRKESESSDLWKRIHDEMQKCIQNNIPQLVDNVLQKAQQQIVISQHEHENNIQNSTKCARNELLDAIVMLKNEREKLQSSNFKAANLPILKAVIFICVITGASIVGVSSCKNKAQIEALSKLNIMTSALNECKNERAAIESNDTICREEMNELKNKIINDIDSHLQYIKTTNELIELNKTKLICEEKVKALEETNKSLLATNTELDAYKKSINTPKIQCLAWKDLLNALDASYAKDPRRREICPAFTLPKDCKDHIK